MQKNIKKILLLIIFSAVLISGIIFTLAEIGNPGESGSTAAPNTLDYGLVGYWDFEEGSGQTVYDKSGNGNDGTLGSSTSIDSADPVFVSGHDSSGENGNGALFDGYDDYVNVLDNDMLDFSTNDFSLSTWFKIEELSNEWRTIIDKGTSGEPGYGIHISSSNKIAVSIEASGGTNQHFETIVPEIGRWYNVIAVFDRDSDIKLYINGSVYSTTYSAGNSNSIDNGYPVRIGSLSRGSLWYFPGSIDDIRVYNRAISEDEVRQLYNQKKPVLELDFNKGDGFNIYDKSFNNNDGIIYGTSGTAESGASTTLTDTDKTWTVDEWIGETIEITSGTGSGQTRTVDSNTETVVTVTSAWDTNPDSTSVYRITSQNNWVSGYNDGGVYFDGTDDYMKIDDDEILDISKEITVETWFNTQDSWNGRTILGKNQAYVLYFGYPNSLVGYIYSGGWKRAVSVQGLFTTNRWYHFAMVYDPDNGVIKLYLDGEELEYSLQDSVSGDINTNSYDFTIGGVIVGGNGMKGSIDDVKIYNYARTADEIRADYNESNAVRLGQNNQDLDYGLVGYWDFEEGSGQTIYDKSGNENNGTLGSSSSVESSDPIFGQGHDSTGENGTGVIFDSVNDYVNLLSNGSNQEFNNTTGSISMWIKSGGSGYNPILTVRNTSNYYLVIREYSDYLWIFSNGGSTPFSVFTPSGSVSRDEWYHLVVTQDGSGVKVYINDKLQTLTGTNTDYWLTDIFPFNSMFNIGGVGIWTEYFDGFIDEVRIYNRALSEDEIRQLYNQKDPILELNFEEGYGTDVRDSSFNDYDAKIYNKINTAISSTSNTLYDNDVSWTVNQWASREVSIIYGTGIGQTRTISSNTSDTLTVSTVWDTNPDSTSRYSITLDGSSVWSERDSGNALNIDNVGYVGFYPNTAPISGTGDFTLESWIKTDDTYTQFIMQQRDSSAVSGEYIFEIDSGKLKYWDYDSTYGINLSSNRSVNDGDWHHTVFTRSGSMGYLFIDGVLDNSYSGSVVDISSSLDFAIGCDFRDAYSYFYGEIDDVKIYNYARTADEIKTDYNESKVAHLGQNNQDLDYGLVGYWDFEEGSGQTVYDKSGNENDGTLGSSTAIQSSDPVFGEGHDSTGENGTGMSFDGLNNYTSMGNDDSLNITGDLTLQAWIKTTDYGYGGIITKLNETTHYGYGLVKSGNKAYFVIMQGAYETGIPTDVAIDDGDWHHIVGVRSSGTDYLYLDGIIQSTTDSNTLTDSGQGVVAGSHYWHSTNSRYPFEGSIDEIRIYNRALSEDEIRQLYNQKKPILELNFDEGSGDTAYDESFNNSNGILGGGTTGYMPVWVDGKFGSALSFDGTDDYVDVGDIDEFNPEDRVVTWSAWFNTESSDEQAILDFIGEDGWDADGELMLKIYSGNLEATMTRRVNEVYEYVKVTSHSLVYDGNWHHASLVWNYDTKTIEMFLDGISQGQDTNTNITLVPSAQVNRKFSVGIKHYNTGDINPFLGSIDNVKIYNYARTADEIKADYNNGLAVHFR